MHNIDAGHEKSKLVTKIIEKEPVASVPKKYTEPGRRALTFASQGMPSFNFAHLVYLKKIKKANS